MNHPSVAVAMSVFNGEAYLKESIESVLQQTYSDFTFTIVDNGSTDSSGSIINSYLDDNRIHYIYQDHSPLGDALNNAIYSTPCDFIVRMDCDDVMLPNRIEKQVSFMLDHPSVALSACRARYIDKSGRVFGSTANLLSSQIAVARRFAEDNAIGLLHPGVIMRRKSFLILNGYRSIYYPADDIDLWTRFAESGLEILTQNDVLMYYRLHNNSVFASNFISTRRKYDWVRSNCIRRRNNVSEYTWPEYLDLMSSRSYFTKFNWYRKAYAKYYYRRAGLFAIQKSN